MNSHSKSNSKNFYYYVCLLFILIMPLNNISFFEIGFHGSPTNILIIGTAGILITNYLLFSSFRRHFHQRLVSFESKHLLIPLLGVLCFDILSTSYHGGLNYLADRIGTVLLVIIFLVGIDSREKLEKVTFFWMIAAFYLAAQNIASQVGLTPVIKGSRISNPRTMFGAQMPFNYAAGFPGAFGWHGMILETGLLFSIYHASLKKYFWAIVALLCLTSIVMMQSRSSYLAAGVSLAVYLLITFYIKRKIVPLFILISPLIILCLYYLPEIISYIAFFTKEFINIGRTNVYSRLFQFKVAIDAGLTNPLLGKGHNYLFNSLSGVVIHNSFLYQLASIGVLGFLLYTYIYVKSLLTAGKLIFFTKKKYYEKKLAAAFFCSLIAMCIELSLFKVISGKEQWLIMYFILLYCSTTFPANAKKITA